MGLRKGHNNAKALLNTTGPNPEGKGFGAELIPFHSPLLGESSLVSFPPLNNMLKFSGLLCLS
jgi:hypothetical protein